MFSLGFSEGGKESWPGVCCVQVDSAQSGLVGLLGASPPHLGLSLLPGRARQLPALGLTPGVYATGELPLAVLPKQRSWGVERQRWVLGWEGVRVSGEALGSLAPWLCPTELSLSAHPLLLPQERVDSPCQPMSSWALLGLPLRPSCYSSLSLPLLRRGPAGDQPDAVRTSPGVTMCQTLHPQRKERIKMSYNPF